MSGGVWSADVVGDGSGGGLGGTRAASALGSTVASTLASGAGGAGAAWAAHAAGAPGTWLPLGAAPRRIVADEPIARGTKGEPVSMSMSSGSLSLSYFFFQRGGTVFSRAGQPGCPRGVQ